MEAISEAILLNKQVLVLFPEISLSSNFYKILKKRFENGFAEWHSGIRNSQKRSIVKNVLNGSLKLVFGARSAVFLPFNNLGLVWLQIFLKIPLLRFRHMRLDPFLCLILLS